MLSTERLREAFNEIDVDHSGAIELSELENLAIKVGLGGTPEDMKSFFDSVDSDHDGKVTFHEFVAWYSLGGTSDIDRKAFKFQAKLLSKLSKMGNKLKLTEVEE